MNFNPETSLDEARSKDKEFKNFFRTLKAIIKDFDIKTHDQKLNESDEKLKSLFIEKKQTIHHHLCNNINTADTILELSSLASATSIYIGQDNKSIKAPLLRDISRYVLFILRVMGFVREDDFGYANDGTSDAQS